MTTKKIRKIHRLTDILISAATLIIGIVLTALVPSLAWLGISLIIAGAFMVPFYKTGYKLKDVDGMFRKEEFILPSECKSEIASFIEGESEELNIDPFNKGGLLLEIYSSPDKSRMYGQISDYENCVFTSQCKISELSPGKLEALLKHQS